MFLIECPICGEAREESEFSPCGEAHIERPPDPMALDDAAFGDYLFFRGNPRGEHEELWRHATGCGKFFHIRRDTVSYRILETRTLAASSSARQTTVPSGS